MAVKFRGQTTWDPILIIFQIASVQLLSYSSLALLLMIACEISGYPPSIVYIFQHEVNTPIHSNKQRRAVSSH